jgi:hypothetical protein
VSAFAPKLLSGGAIRVHIRAAGGTAGSVVLAMVMAARVGVVVRYAALAMVHRRHAVAVMSAVVVHSAAALALFRALVAFVLVVMRPPAALALRRVLAACRVTAVRAVMRPAAVLAIASEARLDPADLTNRLDLFGFLLDERVTARVLDLRLMKAAAAPSMVRLVAFMLGVMLRMMAAVVLTSLHFKGPPVKPA